MNIHPPPPPPINVLATALPLIVLKLIKNTRKNWENQPHLKTYQIDRMKNDRRISKADISKTVRGSDGFQ